MLSENIYRISRMAREELNSTIRLDTPPTEILLEAHAAFDPSFSINMPCRVVSLCHYRFQDGFSMRTQDCDMFDLLYLYSGQVEIQDLQHTHRAGPGDILFLHTNTRYAIRQTGDTPLDLLLIRNHGFICTSYYQLLMRNGFHPISLQNDREFPTLVERIRFYLSYATNANSFLLADAMNRMYTNLYICDAGVEDADNQYHHPGWFLQTVEYIEAHYQKKIPVSALAVAAGMSESHFYRKFHSYTGDSPLHYINLVRLRRAAYLLLHTDLPIKHIALETGFPSASYFVTQFTRQYGKAPGEYRTQGIP